MSSQFINRGLGGDQATASARWARPEDLDVFPSVLWDDLILHEDAAPGLLIGEYQTGTQPQVCDVKDPTGLSQECGYRVGENAALFWNDDRHLVTIAGSRADKGVASIIPNVVLYGGSVLINDPKGEVATLTAVRRGAGSEAVKGLGQKVAVLDPYGVADVPAEYQSGFNPLNLIGEHNPNSVADAGELAAALSPGESGGNSRHFEERARSLIEALILHCVSSEPPARRNLATVYEYATIGIRPPAEINAAYKTRPEDPDIDPFAWLRDRMIANKKFGGVIEAAARVLARMGDNERGGVLSTAERMLSFLKYEGPRRLFTDAMPFDLAELKTAPEGCTIYVCLPVSRLSTHAAMIRMLIQQTITIMERTKGQPQTGFPVLLLLDEFATLGHMRVIEDAAGYMAGFGVKLWAILQDLGQLKSLYRDRWETFLNNAGVLLAWGNADLTTQEYLSKRLGQAELRRIVYGASRGDAVNSGTSGNLQGQPARPGRQGQQPNSRSGSLSNPNGFNSGLSINDGESTSENIQPAALLTPDEVGILFNRESRRMLVLINGAYPLILNRVRYYERFEFMGKIGQVEAYPRPSTNWQEALAFRQAQINAGKDGQNGKADSRTGSWISRVLSRRS